MSAVDPRSHVLITAQDLKRRLDAGEDIVLLSVSGPDGESTEGLPRAVPVSSAASFAGPGGGLKGARPLPDVDTLQLQARSWGVNNQSTVVLYDDNGGLQAARGWWVLKWAGLAKVLLLDGGLAAWIAAGLPLAPLQAVAWTGDVTLKAARLPVLNADDAARYGREAVLIDARASKAFAGDPTLRNGGHIPGSINIPASGNLVEDGRFASAEDLKARYASVVARGLPIGVTCGSGISAAHDIAALATLGVEAALFPGSWSAWSADPDRPVAYGPQ